MNSIEATFTSTESSCSKYLKVHRRARISSLAIPHLLVHGISWLTQCLKLLEVATSPFRARAWLTGYKGKFLGSSAVRGTYVCIDTTSPNEDTTSPGAKTTSFLDTTSL